jgi:hypothetical protein
VFPLLVADARAAGMADIGIATRQMLFSTMESSQIFFYY